MNIGVDARELQQGTRTGIGRMLEAVLAEVNEIRRDIRWTVYTDSRTRTDGVPAAARLRNLSQPVTLWFDQAALPRALARDGVDVFWSPYYKAPLASPCPVTITIHDLLFLKVTRRRIRDALFKPWARLIATRADRILTDSECSRRDIERDLRIEPSRIEVVPLGVSPLFSPEAQRESPELLHRLGIPRCYILTVTNFRPHKNDGLLIRAFSRIAAAHPDVALVLAGRPARPPHAIVELIGSLGLQDRVHLPGPVAEEDLCALYAGAACFAFPSLYEGFGLPVLEAMASGVPVICSAAGALPEIVEGAGWVLPPDDESSWAQAMSDLMVDGQRRDQIRRSGLERARTFTWRRSAEKILSVLEEVAT